MRTLVCRLLLGPSQRMAGLALLKCHKRCLGGQPAGQELGPRLKELRLVAFSRESGGGDTCSSE